MITLWKSACTLYTSPVFLITRVKNTQKQNNFHAKLNYVMSPVQLGLFAERFLFYNERPHLWYPVALTKPDPRSLCPLSVLLFYTLDRLWMSITNLYSSKLGVKEVTLKLSLDTKNGCTRTFSLFLVLRVKKANFDCSYIPVKGINLVEYSKQRQHD